MNLAQLFQHSYLFDKTPGADFAYMVPLLALFLFLLLSSFGLQNWIRKNQFRKAIQKTLPHVVGRLQAFAIVGFVLLWIRNENIPYLSARFLLVCHLVLFVTYLGWSAYAFKNELPKAIDAAQTKKAQKNYLPRKKNRR